MSAVIDIVKTVAPRLVVVVDDDTGRAGLDDHELQALGAEQKKFSSVDECRRFLRGRSQSSSLDYETVVILDLMYPIDPEEGLRFLQDLRQGLTGLPLGTPVVVNSARGDEAVKARANALGATSYVVKGGRPDQLATAVGRAMMGEVRVATAACEIVERDSDAGRLLLRFRGDGGWLAERWADASVAPKESRTPGVGFFIDTFHRWTEKGSETVLRSRPVDADKEAAVFDEIFRDL